MPHLMLAATVDLDSAADALPGEVHRWGRAVLKTEQCWVRADGGAMLVEGVVVEYSRPQHPVAVIAPQRGETSVRLWSRVGVERTAAVQRWLVVVAHRLQSVGAGPLRTTNIPEEYWSDIELVREG
jgi:hypothetical protein